MPRWSYQEVGSVTVDTPPWWTPVFRVWKGIFKIRDLNEYMVWDSGKHNDCILTRIEILQLSVPKNWDSPKCKHRMHAFFACKLGIREIIPLSRNTRINQMHIKGYLLSNQGRECALLAFYLFFLETKEVARFWWKRSKNVGWGPPPHSRPWYMWVYMRAAASLHKLVVMMSTHTCTVILCCMF